MFEQFPVTVKVNSFLMILNVSVGGCVLFVSVTANEIASRKKVASASDETKR